ncbi:MAG: tetratricopeptide repeat protein [bacterium]
MLNVYKKRKKGFKLNEGSFIRAGLILVLLILIFLILSRTYTPGDREAVFRKTIREYKERLENNPLEIEALIGLGDAYYEQVLATDDQKKAVKLADEGIEFYRKAIILAKEGPRATKCQTRVGILYFKKSSLLGGDYYYHEAQKKLESAVAGGEGSKEAHIYLGHIYYRKSQSSKGSERLKWLDKAITHYQEAQTLDPKEATVRFNLAWAFKDRGLYEDSTRIFKELLAAKVLDKESNIDVHIALGWINYVQDHLDESEAQYQQALGLKPGPEKEAKIHYWLGKAYEKGGHLSLARNEWERVLAIDPNHQEARKKLEGK